MINYNDKWTRRKERCLLSSSPIPPGWECSGYPITVPLHFHPFLNFSCGRDNLMPPHAEIPPWVIQFFHKTLLVSTLLPNLPLHATPMLSPQWRMCDEDHRSHLLWVAPTLFKIQNTQRVWTFRRCSYRLHVPTHTHSLPI